MSTSETLPSTSHAGPSAGVPALAPPVGSQNASLVDDSSNELTLNEKDSGVKLAEGKQQSTSSGSDGPYQRPSRRATRESNFEPNAPLKKRLTDLFTPERKVKREPTWRESGMACVKASWLNVLLVFIPVRTSLPLTFAELALMYPGLHRSDGDCIGAESTTPSSSSRRERQERCSIFRAELIFDPFRFLAIIPLAKLLGFGTEEIALRVGQTLGGRESVVGWVDLGADLRMSAVLNATLGNAVEVRSVLADFCCLLTLRITVDCRHHRS